MTQIIVSNNNLSYDHNVGTTYRFIDKLLGITFVC